MNTFLFVLLLVVIFIDLNECYNIPGWSPESVQSRMWPHSKYIFPYRIQSPVNISLANVKRRKLDPLRIHFPWHSSKEMIRIENTGYYLEVLLPHEVDDRPYMTGGPLIDEKYIFEQLHFHWGPPDQRGSEHLLDGKGFPTEVHVVFYNENYGSLEEAVNHPDGVAVVAFFGEFTSKNVDNADLKYLISKLSDVTQPGTSTRSSFKTEFLFMKDIFQQRTYYAFPGSLTTPPFSECVTWIICSQPFHISMRQLEAFRRLRSTNGTFLSTNVRELQDFAGRPLITPLRNSSID
ncbi:carbonic anhydrase 2-like [Planococcus citri]|uniref:carbonic anhydrase 2-like n=1 Tax=Planococcus citri TaxID=170843 RepID=UPI0031F8BD3B